MYVKLYSGEGCSHGGSILILFDEAAEAREEELISNYDTWKKVLINYYMNLQALHMDRRKYIYIPLASLWTRRESTPGVRTPKPSWA